MRKSILFLVVVATFALGIPVTGASAVESSTSIDVPVDTSVYGAPGSTHELASVAVDPALRDASCAVVSTGKNNDSVHPDSRLVVSSGASSVSLEDVESAPGKISEGDGELVLGDTVVVSVVLGPDGIFSGGVSVSISCSPPPPTTTTPPPTTTTPPPPTTTPPPATTTPPTTTPPTTTPPTTTPPIERVVFEPPTPAVAVPVNPATAG